jgi:hypothetical protein
MFTNQQLVTSLNKPNSTALVKLFIGGMPAQTTTSFHGSSLISSLKRSETFQLFYPLAIGKIVVIFAVFSYDNYSLSFLQRMSTIWDSGFYQIIATQGYNSNAPIVFSPVYPSLIYLVNLLFGIPWISALVVTNILSFVFPLILAKTFGFRMALFTELFPTYIVFSTIPYSDVVALIFLSATILLFTKKKILEASGSISLAIATFFNLAWTLFSFVIEFARQKELKKAVLFCLLPLLVGLILILWFKTETGNYLGFFQIELRWQTAFGTPLQQALYLLCPKGQGTLTCQPWEVHGVFLPPPYWLIRNLAFETFYLFGAFYLLKTKLQYNVFLFVYSLSVIVPLFFLLGFAAMSIPRLLLPAFPIFASYSNLLKGPRSLDIYFILSIIMAAAISVIQFFAYFS